MELKVRIHEINEYCETKTSNSLNIFLVAQKSNMFIIISLQGDVVLSCTLPCAFFAYETDRSTSTWPTKSWQLSWLSTRAGKKVANRPDLVGYRLAKERLDASEGEKEAQEFLAKSNVLERNLLAIMLIRPNFNVHKVSCQLITYNS